MIEFLLITSTVTLIMLIWFDSDAFIEYARLVGGKKLFGLEEYEALLKEDILLNYHGYLLKYRNSFFVRLITCPLCFSFWATWIAVLSISDSLILFPICNLVSLVAYKLASKVVSN